MQSFPEPPDAPQSLVDVRNNCDVCGRNLGMFPVAEVCQFCRPIEQENGDVIVGIAYQSTSDECYRLPTTALKLKNDGAVQIMNGPHKGMTFLEDPAKLSRKGNHSFFISDAVLSLYWVQFA